MNDPGHLNDPSNLARELAATLSARAIYQPTHYRRAFSGETGVSAPPELVGEPPLGEPMAAVFNESGTNTDRWELLRAEALSCQICRLCETRTQVVFGEGNPNADLMFVGEAPGRDEDEQGRPFVGRAGKLLTDMIVGMGLKREDVFIANVLKCRPPKNRDPMRDEVEACRPFLEQQIELIRPKIICALGNHALRRLTDTDQGITKLRGKPIPLLGTTVVPTYHPAYLLRNPAAKRQVWEDLKTILGLLGLPVPAPKRRDG
ncbi:MAG: uracil-DNA glycosylase [Planctomycetota bacterium]